MIEALGTIGLIALRYIWWAHDDNEWTERAAAIVVSAGEITHSIQKKSNLKKHFSFGTGKSRTIESLNNVLRQASLDAIRQIVAIAPPEFGAYLRGLTFDELETVLLRANNAAVQIAK